MLLLGAAVCMVTAMLGGYYFMSARRAMIDNIDEQLAGRVAHVRRLAGNVQAVADLRNRPALLEAALTGDDDVLILRDPGREPFIDINPRGIAIPSTLRIGLDPKSSTPDVQISYASEQIPIHWIAVRASSDHDGGVIEIIAGHPLFNEGNMIRSARTRLLWGTLGSIAIAMLLVWIVLHRGLRPLRRVAKKAAEIHPLSLEVRLPVDGAPKEVLHMVTAVNEMLDRISTGYDRLSQYSENLAHEIRTPIGTLIGQTQVALQRSRSVSDYEEVLESNLEELMRLRQIAQNILFLAQSDHDTLEVGRVPISLQVELRKIAEYFEGLAEEKGLRFEVDAQGEVSVDPTLFQRAISNLVLNAVRYSSPHTVIKLHGRSTSESAIISVHNQGESIPPDQLERLFDRFYRGDTARSRPAESHGLGLAIVKAVMDRHRGTVRASSSPSGGITFELRFPHG